MRPRLTSLPVMMDSALKSLTTPSETMQQTTKGSRAFGFLLSSKRNTIDVNGARAMPPNVAAIATSA